MTLRPPTRDVVLRILAQALPSLREEFDVGSLSVFGSVARGDATAGSDVDILVEFLRPILKDRVLMEARRAA